MQHTPNETEVKLAVSDPQAARKLLRAAGFRLYKRRVFETNLIFDTPQSTLRDARNVLRVREAGAVRSLTYKGVPTYLKHKSREELELRISDAATMTTILQRLGYQPAFRYEKFRTEYRLPDRTGIATLDETPVGTYFELEGPAEWIDRTAALLHFSEQDYITASYALLYRNWCEKRGIPPTNMVFDPPPAAAR